MKDEYDSQMGTEIMVAYFLFLLKALEKLT